MPDQTPSPVDELLSWLIAMDDPQDESGMRARQTVTLTKIIERGRDVQRWLGLVRDLDTGETQDMDLAPPRLWKVHHPYYGADGYSETLDSFADLRARVDSMDEDMNMVYRWDWDDYREPHHDALFIEGEHRDKQRFRVFLLMPRKERFISLECPIRHDEENDVMTWLRGPRCAGYLRTLWNPILGHEGETPAPASMRLGELAAVLDAWARFEASGWAQGDQFPRDLSDALEALGAHHSTEETSG